MDRGDVNELILDRVNEIEDSNRRKFIDDILQFERSKIDQKMPRYKDRYNELIGSYTTDE